MSEKKVIVVVCGGAGGIGKSVREAIALSKLENSGVELIEFKPEKSDIKELADQLNSLSERENRMMQELFTMDAPDKIQEYFIPNPKHSPKGHQRPYKFHK